VERGEWIKTEARRTPLQKRLKCAARVSMSLKMCTSCCCTDGLMGGGIELQLARGSQRDCAAWFAAKDIWLRAINAFTRGAMMIWIYSKGCWKSFSTPVRTLSAGYKVKC